jgi:trehalose 6-phosphate synthase/phosphatase
VLSRTIGAAAELKDAIQVNPIERGSLVKGLARALSTPKAEIRRRASRMQQHLQQFTVQNWADLFMGSLPQSTKNFRRPKVLSTEHQQALIGDYMNASKRLLLLDYDGVLRGFETDPAAAKPSREVVQLLRQLGKDSKNDLMIISGRSKADLGAWFGKLPIAIAAEHGALIRRKGGKNWHKTSSSGLDWRHPVSVLFKHYSNLTPGALVEQKEWAVVWHYRAASPYYAQKHLVALRRLVRPMAEEYDLQILEGNKVLEVRPSDVSKRRAAQEWLIHDHDFMLCIGDDTTDEDMFVALPPHAYTIKVGRGQTHARFRVKNVDEVLNLLAML